MKKTISFITICFSFLFCIVAEAQEFDFCDAQEGSTANAYPSLWVTSLFPICVGCGHAGWVQHNSFNQEH
jgi:hypothetical protein